MRKRFNKKNLKRVLHLCLIVSGILVVVSSMGGASAQDVTQGYAADDELQNGMLVRVKPDNKAKVEALTQEKESDMFGVVVSSSEAPVSISDPEARQVFVATLGQYDVLVSTQNGVIRTGDSIVISSLKGVGMKTDEFHKVIIGKALESFGDNSDAESHVKLEGSGNVALGRIRIDISVKRNPQYNGDTIAGVPHQLSKLAYAVTDKPVTALRIYACLAVIGMCILIAGAVLYSGIHSGMTSIGRNPLAKKSILRSLIVMILTSLSVVSGGLFAVYLILKI
jgi:uncharacterized protein YjeT (DUF2065 family)